MKLDSLFEAMWQKYVAVNPDALTIHDLLAQENGPIVNDHIALRTFDLDPVRIDALARAFTDAGYEKRGYYRFEAKRLVANHFEHSDATQPKIFISAFDVGSLGAKNRKLVERLIHTVDPGQVESGEFCYSGRHWNLSYSEYLALLEESEYAAWLAAFGFRPNHFTVFVNALEHVDSVQAVNTLLKRQGFMLNESGGEVKGSPMDCLEQSSTLASRVVVDFSDRSVEIPGCYYEFAKRYPLSDGKLFQGFVTGSADRIFESTNAN
jgi:hypothetical protein